jgi:hypothetical protein
MTPILRTALSTLLAVAAGGLLLAGGLLHRRAGARPSLKVVSPGTRLGRDPAVRNARLRVGRALTVKGHDRGAALTDGRGGTLTLSGKARLFYAGRGRAGPRYLLSHGTAFARCTRGRGRLTVITPLGEVTIGDGLAEVRVSQPGVGLASETPRVLWVSVAEGRARVAPRGSRPAAPVPAGVALEVRQGDQRPRPGRRLTPGEWQRLSGSPASFADPETPLPELPAYTWAPRCPGRRGPTPGSRPQAELRYVRELGGCLLAGRPGAPEAGWVYDAGADRWTPLDAAGLADATEPGNRPPPSTPPGAHHGAVAGVSGQGPFLYYGGVGEGDGETWLLPRGAGEWRRLEPAANPPPRADAGLGYDPAAGVFVLFGGAVGGQPLDDVWVLRPGAGDCTPPGVPGFPPRLPPTSGRDCRESDFALRAPPAPGPPEAPPAA